MSTLVVPKAGELIDMSVMLVEVANVRHLHVLWLLVIERCLRESCTWHRQLLLPLTIVDIGGIVLGLVGIKIKCRILKLVFWPLRLVFWVQVSKSVPVVVPTWVWLSTPRQVVILSSPIIGLDLKIVAYRLFTRV